MLSFLCSQDQGCIPGKGIVFCIADDGICFADDPFDGFAFFGIGFFADGTAVRQVGEETFRLCREHLDGVITVNTDEVCSAIKDIFEDTRAIPEPSGALAIAGLKKFVEERNLKDCGLVAITSGANMDFDRLRHISERAEIGEHREALLAVSIPEHPGSYRRFIELLGTR